MSKGIVSKKNVLAALQACSDYTDRRNYTPGSLELYRAVLAMFQYFDGQKTYRV